MPTSQVLRFLLFGRYVVITEAGIMDEVPLGNTSCHLSMFLPMCRFFSFSFVHPFEYLINRVWARSSQSGPLHLTAPLTPGDPVDYPIVRLGYGALMQVRNLSSFAYS